MMSQDWKAFAPADWLANEAVYDEWSAKPSWTLPEAVYLIVGLNPSKIGDPWEGLFPAEEYDKVVDTLRRAVGTRGKHGLAPISGEDEGDWLFKPKVIIRNAVHYGLEVSDLLLERAKVARASPETSHGNAVRYARQREEILMAGLAALAYRPEKFRNKQGRLVKKHLADFLEENWPGERAPQTAETMAQLFGEVLIFGKWTDTKPIENK